MLAGCSLFISWLKSRMKTEQVACNFFMTDVPIIKKPVYWFALQINGPVYIWYKLSISSNTHSSKSRLKIPQWGQWRHSSVFTIKFEHNLRFLHVLFQIFLYYWLWPSKCLLRTSVLFCHTHPFMTSVPVFPFFEKSHKTSTRVGGWKNKHQPISTRVGGWKNKRQPISTRVGGRKNKHQPISTRVGGWKNKRQQISTRVGGWKNKRQPISKRVGGWKNKHQTIRVLFKNEGIRSLVSRDLN